MEERHFRELFTYYRPPLDLTPEQWDKAVDSQAKAFLVGVQEAARLVGKGGRIVAITYRPGGLTAGWQPAVAHCSAKAALESLVRHFAVALASRGITVNAISPGVTEDSILNSLSTRRAGRVTCLAPSWLDTDASVAIPKGMPHFARRSGVECCISDNSRPDSLLPLSAGGLQ